MREQTATSRLTMPLWPDAGQMIGISRTKAYEMARSGEIPTIKAGSKYLVLVAPLKRMLGVFDAAA